MMASKYFLMNEIYYLRQKLSSIQLLPQQKQLNQGAMNKEEKTTNEEIYTHVKKKIKY